MSIFNWLKLQPWLAFMLFLLMAMPAQAVEASSDALAAEVQSSLHEVVNYYKQEDRNYASNDFRWAVFGLTAAGEDLTSPSWTPLTRYSVFDYWASKVEGELDTMDPGEVAMIAISLMKNGYDPTDFNGINLLDSIISKQDPHTGGMGKTDFGIYNHALSMIALEMYGYVSNDYKRAQAITFLQDHYDDFNIYSVDSLAFTLNVLPFIEGETSLNKDQIIQQLKDAQNQDGSYTFTSIWEGQSFSSPSPETAVEVLAGLNQLGVNVYDAPWNKSVQYLLDRQIENGGFAAPWDSENANPMTTSRAIVAIANLHQAAPFYVHIDPSSLEPYESAMPNHIKVYGGFTKLTQLDPASLSNGKYTLNASQVYVQVDLQGIATDAPLAVLVKAMKGNQVVDLAVLEGSQAEKLTAGLQLAEGDYTIEVHYWNDLTGQPAVIKESDILAVKVQ